MRMNSRSPALIPFTSQELALSLDDFSDRILEPAMSVLAANIEADALSMYKDVFNLYDQDTVAFALSSMLADVQKADADLVAQSIAAHTSAGA